MNLGAKEPYLHVIDKNGNNGGMDMDKYVTHKELNHSFDNLSNKMEQLSLKRDIKDEEINRNIKALSSRLDSQSKLIWWMMGIVSSGIVIPLLVFVVNAILKTK